jgi:hypothetical protein
MVRSRVASDGGRLRTTRWRGVAAQGVRDSVRGVYTFALHGWSPFGHSRVPWPLLL